jgi:hypothetical protein
VRSYHPGWLLKTTQAWLSATRPVMTVKLSQCDEARLDQG